MPNEIEIRHSKFDTIKYVAQKLAIQASSLRRDAVGGHPEIPIEFYPSFYGFLGLRYKLRKFEVEVFGIIIISVAITDFLT
jgi:hypothetical protein